MLLSMNTKCVDGAAMMTNIPVMLATMATMAAAAAAVPVVIIRTTTARTMMIMMMVMMASDDDTDLADDSVVACGGCVFDSGDSADAREYGTRCD